MKLPENPSKITRKTYTGQKDGRESCGMLLSAVHTDKGEEKLNLIMISDAIPAGAKLC